MDYRYGSHTVFKIQYHFVFVTKYRYKVLRGDIGLKVRELSVRIIYIYWYLHHRTWRPAK